MIDYKVKIGLIPDVRDLGDFDTRKGMFEPAKGKERKDKAIKYIKEKFLSVATMVKNFNNLKITQVGSRLNPFKSVMANEM